MKANTFEYSSILNISGIRHHATTRLMTAIAAFIICSWLLGCVSIEISGQSTAQMKQQISDSIFYKSTKFFYPADTTDNPRLIAKLARADIEAFESEFAAKLKLVINLHNAHRETLAKVLGDQALNRPSARLFLLNRNLAEAQTVSDGEISIDVRVLHAMLQSALLVAFRAEVDLQRLNEGKDFTKPSNYSPAEEKLVVDFVLAQRKLLDQAEGKSIVGTLLQPNLNERGKQSNELDWFGMSKVQNDFNRAAVRYDAQLLYLIAHEVGHIVLKHFSKDAIVLPASEDEEMDDCSVRRAKERAADFYATILITLASAQQAAADIIPFEAAGSVPVFEGFDTFFEYAYGYAGFDAGGTVATCQYPRPAERLALVLSTYKKIRAAQIDVIFDNARKLK